MNNQRGFTFVEMALLVAILGVVAAIVVASVTGFLGQSRREAYNTEIKTMQAVVNQFFSRIDTPRFRGENQFPLLGAAKGAFRPYAGDDDLNPGLLPSGIPGNPLGGTMGGTPLWVDDGDGVRGPGEEALNDEDATGAEPGWHVQPVVVRGATFFVDSRDFFIDFDLASEMGVLREPPRAAAPDNCPTSNRCQGSYIFFLNANNKVQTLLGAFPSPETTGFQGVFP